MTERWCWFYEFDINLVTAMNYESSMNLRKKLTSMTLSWNIAELVAIKCADECLEKRYYD